MGDVTIQHEVSPSERGRLVSEGRRVGVVKAVHNTLYMVTNEHPKHIGENRELSGSYEQDNGSRTDFPLSWSIKKKFSKFLSTW